MARRFGTDIELLGFSIINAMLHPVSSNPGSLTSGDKGRIWFNTTTNRLMVWDGTSAIDFLSRTNHVDTQTASTISDFNTAVRTSRLDQMAAPTADVSLASHKLTNVTDPSSAQDAATKNYVDTSLASVASGSVLKGAVRGAALTNINIASAPSTIDGITPTNGDIFLLTGQTTGSQNGPYVWTAAAAVMNRATNWDTSGEAVLGSYWIVEQGTNADTFAMMTNDTAITLGSTTPTFLFRGASGATYTAGNGINVAGTVISAVADPATGKGIVVASGGISVDPTVVARKFAAAVPATTSGAFTVSGLVVTVNHALNNDAPLVSIMTGGTPAAGYTTNQPVECSWVRVDANNIAVTFPALATSNWIISVVG